MLTAARICELESELDELTLEDVIELFNLLLAQLSTHKVVISVVTVPVGATPDEVMDALDAKLRFTTKGDLVPFHIVEVVTPIQLPYVFVLVRQDSEFE